MITDYEYVAPPIKNSAFAFTVLLTNKTTPDTFQDNPTIVAGDVKVSKDGGALVNLTYLPTVTGKIVRVQLTAAEMNANNVVVVFSDAAGGQWQDFAAIIRTMSPVNDGVVVALDVTDINAYVGVTVDETITGLSIPSNWEKIYFTAKKKLTENDSWAVIQVQESNPPDALEDGLKIVNRTLAVLADGSLTVDQPAGTIVLRLEADATKLLDPNQPATYDIKCICSDGTISRLRGGNFRVDRTETVAVS